MNSIFELGVVKMLCFRYALLAYLQFTDSTCDQVEEHSSESYAAVQSCTSWHADRDKMSGNPPARRQKNVGSQLLTAQENECVFN